MRGRWVLLVASALAVACDREPEKTRVATAEPPPVPAPAGPVPSQPFSVDSITRGAALYREHCLQCHGPEAQGHPDWQTPSDGTFMAAPPLNGTGNVWRRKKRDIVAIIKRGATRDDIPAMPAYKGRLSDQQIEDIITWFQVLWPPDVYELWLNANTTNASPKG